MVTDHMSINTGFIGAPGQTSNAGCGIESSSPSSFGTSLNAAGGGVYAMQWTSKLIKIWFFPRNASTSALHFCIRHSMPILVPVYHSSLPHITDQN